MFMGTEAHNLRAMAREFKCDHQLLFNQNAMKNLELEVPEPLLDTMHDLHIGSREVFLDPNEGLSIGDPEPFLDPNEGLNIGAPEPFWDPNNLIDLPFVLPFPDPNKNLASSSSTSPEGDHHEDTEGFSDIVLSYISRMLMEENMDDKLDMYQEPSAIQAAEKPFYDVLGQKYPYSPDQPPVCSLSNHNSDSPDDSSSTTNGNSSSSGISSSSGVVDHWWSSLVSADYSSQSSFGSSVSFSNINEGLEDAFLNAIKIPDVSLKSLPALQFMKGAEEARKFLPSKDKLVIDLEAIGFPFHPEPKEESKSIKVKAEEEEREYSINGLRGRKNPHTEDLDLEEGRSVKQSAVFTEEDIRTEMFDQVLLCSIDKCGGQIQGAKNEAAKNSQNGFSKASGGRKGRGKRQAKKELVDLRTLLIQCAQMVAANDRRSTNELLKQIREHCSPFGDGSQRLAHYFTDGLEARMAGTGSQIYHSHISKRRSASDVLRGYRLFLAACPFKRILYFASNMTILNAAENATTVHIVDFGIYYGFQWPCFIQRLSKRIGGPPKLRITGIDVPQPGFRPSERIEETGRRLADYAQSFGVPFKYHAIASNWEDVRVEDLNIGKDELLVVNFLHRNHCLMDETVSVDSPRNMVLNTIRKMNPSLFLLGVMNGSYNAPFFVTRFREALFYFSSLFDMLETNVSREDQQRLLLERDIFGKEALSVIACEGIQRVERPETYKQWQARILRAGFEQLPLDPDILKKAKCKVRGCYHKDFLIDEDSRWLLQGWKGRIIQAQCIWRPAKIH